MNLTILQLQPIQLQFESQFKYLGFHIKLKKQSQLIFDCKLYVNYDLTEKNIFNFELTVVFINAAPLI